MFCSFFFFFSENVLGRISESRILGNSCIQEGDAHAAYRFYTKCLELDDSASVLPVREKAIILANRSLASFKSQKYHSALKDAIDAVKTDNLYAMVSPFRSVSITH